MNCNTPISRIAFHVAFVLFGVMSITCDESLPTYKFPSNVLSVQVTRVEQVNDRLAPPGRQAVHFQITCENIYTDIFQDSVDVRGIVKVWWKRKPSRSRTIYITQKYFSNRSLIQNGQLTMLPGQQFTMDVYWNLKGDDSVSFLEDMMYQPLHRCEPNNYALFCADPEIFSVQPSISIFDRLGFIPSSSVDFPFVMEQCENCGVPPCPCGSGG